MNEKERLSLVLEMDGLNFSGLGSFCLHAYRMNINPLPLVRNYMKKNGIDIPIHYIETSHGYDDSMLKNRICGRKTPLIVGATIKSEGFVKRTGLYFVDQDEPLYHNIIQLQ